MVGLTLQETQPSNRAGYMLNQLWLSQIRDHGRVVTVPPSVAIVDDCDWCGKQVFGTFPPQPRQISRIGCPRYLSTDNTIQTETDDGGGNVVRVRIPGTYETRYTWDGGRAVAVRGDPHRAGTSMRITKGFVHSQRVGRVQRDGGRRSRSRRTYPVGAYLKSLVPQRDNPNVPDTYDVRSAPKAPLPLSLDQLSRLPRVEQFRRTRLEAKRALADLHLPRGTRRPDPIHPSGFILGTSSNGSTTSFVPDPAV